MFGDEKKKRNANKPGKFTEEMRNRENYADGTPQAVVLPRQPEKHPLGLEGCEVNKLNAFFERGGKP